MRKQYVVKCRINPKHIIDVPVISDSVKGAQTLAENTLVNSGYDSVEVLSCIELYCDIIPD